MRALYYRLRYAVLVMANRAPVDRATYLRDRNSSLLRDRNGEALTNRS